MYGDFVGFGYSALCLEVMEYSAHSLSVLEFLGLKLMDTSGVWTRLPQRSKVIVRQGAGRFYLYHKLHSGNRLSAT